MQRLPSKVFRTVHSYFLRPYCFHGLQVKDFRIRDYPVLGTPVIVLCHPQRLQFFFYFLPRCQRIVHRCAAGVVKPQIFVPTRLCPKPFPIGGSCRYAYRHSRRTGQQSLPKALARSERRASSVLHPVRRHQKAGVGQQQDRCFPPPGKSHQPQQCAANARRRMHFFSRIAAEQQRSRRRTQARSKGKIIGQHRVLPINKHEQCAHRKRTGRLQYAEQAKAKGGKGGHHQCDPKHFIHIYPRQHPGNGFQDPHQGGVHVMVGPQRAHSPRNQVGVGPVVIRFAVRVTKKAERKKGEQPHPTQRLPPLILNACFHLFPLCPCRSPAPQIFL